MAFILGKDTVITVNSQDLSAFITNAVWTRSADVLDTTTFGKDSHTKVGGLFDGSLTIDGIMDGAGTTTPDVKVGDALGTVVAYSVDSGASSAPYTGNCLVASYVETMAVAETVQWSATLELTGDVA